MTNEQQQIILILYLEYGDGVFTYAQFDKKRNTLKINSYIVNRCTVLDLLSDGYFITNGIAMYSITEKALEGMQYERRST